MAPTFTVTGVDTGNIDKLKAFMKSSAVLGEFHSVGNGFAYTGESYRWTGEFDPTGKFAVNVIEGRAADVEKSVRRALGVLA